MAIGISCLCSCTESCWLGLSTCAYPLAEHLPGWIPLGTCPPHPTCTGPDFFGWGKERGMGSIWHRAPESSSDGHFHPIYPGLPRYWVNLSSFRTFPIQPQKAGGGHRLEFAQGGWSLSVLLIHFLMLRKKSVDSIPSCIFPTYAQFLPKCGQNEILWNGL